MRLPRRPWLVMPALLGAGTFAAAACGPPPTPSNAAGGATAEPSSSDTSPTSSGDTGTSSATAPTGEPSSVPTGSSSASGSTQGKLPPCRLPEPVKSGDACKTADDCDVSAPCHARACVAKAKAHPGDPSTVCTRILDCHSIDANSCGCLDGVCALIPPK